MSYTNYKKAQEQWNSFCENIKYQQRYFILHNAVNVSGIQVKKRLMIANIA